MMNSTVNHGSNSRNSRLISLNRSPCDCHEGDERYVVSSAACSKTPPGADTPSQLIRRREIPRTPTREDQQSRARNNLVKSRSSRSLSRSRPANYQDNRRNYLDDDEEDGQEEDQDNDYYGGFADDTNLFTGNGYYLNQADLEAAETKLHVLAIKPRVAPRPRDNILFEGDMDLRTTFETTYEALARTRLEHFREYQLSLMEKQQQQLLQQNQKQQSNIVAIKSQAKAQNVTGHSLEDQDTIDKEDRDVSVAHSAFGTSERNDLDGDHSEQAKLLSESRVQICNIDDDNSECDILTDSPQNQKTISNNKTINTDHCHESCNNHNVNSQSKQTPYIDPDLSPLIVYDSNMNRLVTVGLRKRSKYRPSTSLRSGANGFFGPTDATDNCSKQQQNQHNESSVVAKINKPDEAQNGTKNCTQHQQDNRMRGNFHANSKRRIRDNINLQDHIRGDNLISHSPSPTWDYQQRQQQQQEYDQQQTLVQSVGINQEDSEELALNEEVRRISANEPINPRPLNIRDPRYTHSSEPKFAEPSDQINSAGSGSHVNRIVTPANNNNLDRSKLERICQNQSIDIFKAKYLDEEM